MMNRGAIVFFLTCYVNLCFFGHYASGSFPRAQNVTWSSLNFKTLLKWSPTPTADYSYTVEYNVIGQDRQRDPHCIRTTETECDLSKSMTDLKATYVADIVSEPPLGVNSDIIEFPFTSSERFCPYRDTDISKPEKFKIEVGKDERTITLYVKDPLTALFEGNRQLSIRDVFADELQYKVTYMKAQSSGKKTYVSKSSEIVLSGLDKGVSYCFYVQAYIPSRDYNKQLGQPSDRQCSHNDTAVYSIGAIVGCIVVILAILSAVIAITVFYCKRRAKAQNSTKEGLPLREV